jgi:AraC-like DNA-binding protein
MTADLLPLNLYRDLCREIGIIYDRIDQLKRERKYYLKMCTQAPGMIGATDYSLERVSHNFSLIPFDWAYDKIRKIDAQLHPLQSILAEKELTKRNMEKKLGQFEGLNYQVAYLKMQGYSLKDISDKLGYSEGYIRRVSAKLQR